MDFGIVLQNDPPASDVVRLAVAAEEAGFDYVWTFDSHLLWQEPFVIYPAILAATRRVMSGALRSRGQSWRANESATTGAANWMRSGGWNGLSSGCGRVRGTRGPPWGRVTSYTITLPARRSTA